MTARALAAALLVLVALAAPATAQPDAARLLVGKWEGEYQLVQRRGPTNTNRTLVIESVTPREGGWTAKGQYGVTGERLRPLEFPVEVAGGQLRLHFVAGAQTQIDLRLQGDRQLVGTFTPTGAGQRARDLPFRLQKVE